MLFKSLKSMKRVLIISIGLLCRVNLLFPYSPCPPGRPALPDPALLPAVLDSICNCSYNLEYADEYCDDRRYYTYDAAGNVIVEERHIFVECGFHCECRQNWLDFYHYDAGRNINCKIHNEWEWWWNDSIKSDLVRSDSTVYNYTNGIVTDSTNFKWDTSANMWIGEWRRVSTFDPSGMLSEVTGYAWIQDLQEWQVSEVKNYDGCGNLILENQFEWDTLILDMLEQVRAVYTYDSNDRLLEENHFRWDPTVQDMLQRVRGVYVYNSDGRLVEENHFEWDPTVQDMLQRVRGVYAYNSDGRLVEENHFEWDLDKNNLVERWRNVYVYNDRDTLVEEHHYEWVVAKNSLVETYRNVNVFDDHDNLVEEIAYTWIDELNELVIYRHMIYKFDDDVNLIESIEYRRNSETNNLYICRRIEYTYDDRGNQINQTYFIWDSYLEILVPDERYTYKYDDRRNQVDVSYFTWDPYQGEWIGVSWVVQLYDVHNNLVEFVRYNWNSNLQIWQGNHKTEYVFDMYGHNTEVKHYDWIVDIGAWQETSRDIVTYKTMGNLTEKSNYRWSSQSGWQLNSRFSAWWSEIVLPDCENWSLIVPDSLNWPVDEIEVTSTEERMIYLVPLYTQMNLKSIREHCLDSAQAASGIPVTLSLEKCRTATYCFIGSDSTGSVCGPHSLVLFSDNEPPVLSAPDTVYHSHHIPVTSSEDAMIYLVPKGTYRNLSYIRNVCVDSAVAEVSVPVNLYLPVLESGTYWLYGADTLFRLSDPAHFYLWLDTIPPLLFAYDSIYQPEYIKAYSTDDGMIYLVPEFTTKNLTGIRSVSMDSTGAAARVPVVIPLTGYKNDVYWLYATDTVDNISEPAIFTIHGVGVNEEISGNLRIYPNPADHFLTIQTEIQEPLTVKITSIDGRILYESMMNGPFMELDMSPIKRGIYFITVRSDEFSRTEKIMKL